MGSCTNFRRGHRGARDPGPHGRGLAGRLLGLLYTTSTSATRRPRTARAGGGAGAQVRESESVVISYQGDGDLASIGLAEIVSAGSSGRLTVIFVNNAIYG